MEQMGLQQFGHGGLKPGRELFFESVQFGSVFLQVEGIQDPIGYKLTMAWRLGRHVTGSGRMMEMPRARTSRRPPTRRASILSRWHGF